jgi:proteasome accessory factor A
VATFLKVGTTALVLAMIEDDFLPRTFTFAAPVRTLRQVSYDLSLRQPLELADGGTVTALEVQWELFDRAKKYADAVGLDCIGESGPEVLRRWEEVLTGLESDPSSLADQVDWIAKHRMIDGYRERHGLQWGNAKLNALDLQYHDLRPERSLARRVGLQRLTTDEEVEAAVTDPPPDTRAWFRGTCLRRWPTSIVAANWDSMVFDVGVDPLRRVPMMEPLRGTEAMLGELVESSDTPVELLQKLEA